MAQGCPCTPELVCRSDNLGFFKARRCDAKALRYCTVNLQPGARWPAKCTGFTEKRKGGRTGDFSGPRVFA